jgi:hypothetical protein
MPGGIFIDVRDRIYVADSLSGPQTNAGWIRGIRIGDARDGAVSEFIPDATQDVMGESAVIGKRPLRLVACGAPNALSVRC